MAMISGGCLGVQTLKLAPSLYKPQSLLFPIKSLILTLSPSLQTLRFSQKPRFASLCRAFSSPAVQIASNTVQEEKGTSFAKPQWRAAIDFKWIRDNKDLVAANIENRNSSANLELVLELYEKFLNLQKVRLSIFCCF